MRRPIAEEYTTLLLEWFSKFSPDERRYFCGNVCNATLVNWHRLSRCPHCRDSGCVKCPLTKEELELYKREPHDVSKCLDSHPECQTEPKFKCQIKNFHVIWCAMWTQEDRSYFNSQFVKRYPMFMAAVYAALAEYTNQEGEILATVKDMVLKQREKGLETSAYHE